MLCCVEQDVSRNQVQTEPHWASNCFLENLGWRHRGFFTHSKAHVVGDLLTFWSCGVDPSFTEVQVVLGFWAFVVLFESCGAALNFIDLQLKWPWKAQMQVKSLMREWLLLRTDGRFRGFEVKLYETKDSKLLKWVLKRVFTGSAVWFTLVLLLLNPLVCFLSLWLNFSLNRHLNMKWRQQWCLLLLLCFNFFCCVILLSMDGFAVSCGHFAASVQ